MIEIILSCSKLEITAGYKCGQTTQPFGTSEETNGGNFTPTCVKRLRRNRAIKTKF